MLASQLGQETSRGLVPTTYMASLSLGSLFAAECLDLNFPSKSFLLLLNIALLPARENCIKEAKLRGGGVREKQKTGSSPVEHCSEVSNGLTKQPSMGTQLREPSCAFFRGQR